MPACIPPLPAFVGFIYCHHPGRTPRSDDDALQIALVLNAVDVGEWQAGHELPVGPVVRAVVHAFTPAQPHASAGRDGAGAYGGELAGQWLYLPRLATVL